MTRDFKIGLICGSALAFVALIWVVTRPTLSPQARMTTPPSSPGPKTSAAETQLQTPEPESTPTESQFEPSVPTTPIETTASRTEQPAFVPEVTEPIQTAGIDSTANERDPNAAPVRYHIVRKDETLSSISQLYYDTPNQWRKIVAANPETIKDANRISPGTKIVIPE